MLQRTACHPSTACNFGSAACRQAFHITSSAKGCVVTWRSWRRPLLPFGRLTTALRSRVLCHAGNPSEELPARFVDAASEGDGAAASFEEEEELPPTLEDQAGDLALGIANLFPLWLALVAGAVLARPQLMTWFHREWLTHGLSVTMLSMGMTLTLEDFKSVSRQPGLVALGAVLQYTIMPALGFIISRSANIPTPYAIGICLVASCPGGVASNVITYLARADVPLSVAMTTVSTLAAVVATPVLTRMLVGQLVPVSAVALLLSTLQVVLIPVVFGAYLNQMFPSGVRRLAPFTPLVAVTCTILVMASVLSANAAAVCNAGGALLGAIIALHMGGFGLGYGISRLLGISERRARTNAIEVGMQNSVLGAVLAGLHFADPRISVPCAISACIHSLLGSALAGFWRLQLPQDASSPILEGM